jgi:hypothetical protein
VGGNDESKPGLFGGGELTEGVANTSGRSFDEARVIVEDAQLVDSGGTLANFGLRC